MENVLKQKIVKAIPKIILNNQKEIPQIGFGTYELKGDDCYRSVLHALKSGYRHIDTASIYRNEELVGKAIHQFLKENSDISRQDLFITSKISPKEQGYDNALLAVKQILQRLQIQYLDLILIHWPGVTKMKPENSQVKGVRQETWRAFIELKKQNLVHSIGVSNFLQRHIESLWEVDPNTMPAVNQFELHPLLTNLEIVQFCQKHNIAVEAYSSLARQDEKLIKNEIMINMSNKYSKTVSQIALRWAVQKGYIVIPKSKTEKYIEQNFNIFDFEITQEDINLIDSLNQNYHTCWDPTNVF